MEFTIGLGVLVGVLVIVLLPTLVTTALQPSLQRRVAKRYAADQMVLSDLKALTFGLASKGVR